MSTVIIKGEIHTSESDLEEEREFLTEGVDAVILESGREDADYGLLRSWYSTAMWIVGIVFFKTLYTDHSIISDLAEAQGANMFFTRESDAELLDNAHAAIKILAALTFYGIFSISIFYGLITGNTLYGAVFLLGSGLIPILILRVHEMNQQEASKNRDQIIAEKIARATEDNERVLTIVGAKHMDGILDKLPEEIDPEVHPPVYSVFSRQHLQEVLLPGFTAMSVLFVLYLLILEFAKFLYVWL